MRPTPPILVRPGLLPQLQSRWENGSFLCVGLDSDYDRLPWSVRRGRSITEALTLFNRQIVEATHEWVVAYKPNASFYERLGAPGLQALVETVRFIKAALPDLTVILDAKRGDIGTSNVGYAAAAFDLIGADWVTVHPYLGREAMAPFLERADRGAFVLVKTSNPGAGDLQDLPVGVDKRPLYQVIAEQVATSWNGKANCGVVVGAPYPDALREVRKIVGDMPILVPGVGSQGGQIAPTVRAGLDSRGGGLVINSSRDVIYASAGADFADAAAAAAARITDEIRRSLRLPRHG